MLFEFQTPSCITQINSTPIFLWFGSISQYIYFYTSVILSWISIICNGKFHNTGFKMCERVIEEDNIHNKII